MPKIPKTDLKRLRALSDSDIALDSEHPEAEIKQIISGITRRGLQRLPGKASISLRVDNEVLEWFKSQGDGYQTRMNAVLKAYKEACA